MTTSTLSNTDPGLRHFWHPVAASDAVRDEPIRLTLLGEELVACRLEGELVVALDRCPHRLAPLSAGRLVGSHLQCPYHGWQFDRTGACVELPSQGERPIPPRARLASCRAEERNGLVFVALEDPLVDLPVLDFLDGRTLAARLDFAGPYGAGMLIDNQLDAAHFPFVHAGTFGAIEAEQTPAYELSRERFGFTTTLAVPFRAVHDRRALGSSKPIVQRRTMNYRYQAPFCVELRLDYASGGSSVIAFFASPETAERTRLWVFLSFEEPGGLSDEEIEARVAFEHRVVSEDLALQARFSTQALPLERTLECHVAADRSALAYRQILSELLERTAGGDSDLLALEPTPRNVVSASPQAALS